MSIFRRKRPPGDEGPDLVGIPGRRIEILVVRVRGEDVDDGLVKIILEFDTDAIDPRVGQTYTVRVAELVHEVRS